MIYEQRTYDIHPQHFSAYLELFEKLAMSIRGSGQYGQLIGFWSTESGPLNRVVHIWAYESIEQRRLARAALMQNNLWANDFLPKALPMIARMESALLNATPFSPLK
jgi:NIPSNAP